MLTTAGALLLDEVGEIGQLRGDAAAARASRRRTGTISFQHEHLARRPVIVIGACRRSGRYCSGGRAALSSRELAICMRVAAGASPSTVTTWSAMRPRVDVDRALVRRLRHCPRTRHRLDEDRHGGETVREHDLRDRAVRPPIERFASISFLNPGSWLVSTQPVRPVSRRPAERRAVDAASSVRGSCPRSFDLTRSRLKLPPIVSCGERERFERSRLFSLIVCARSGRPDVDLGAEAPAVAQLVAGLERDPLAVVAGHAVDARPCGSS